MKNVVAIIQARMGSTRMPGKSLRLLAGKPVIMHVVDRVKAASNISTVVVATTTEPQDDVLAAYLEENSVPVFRGSTTDVLSRYVSAVKKFGGDPIVRLTGDDPLKDPGVITHVIQKYLDRPEDFDYVSNTILPTFPEGQDTEVIRTEALFAIERLTTDAYDHEHVTPYLYNNQGKFRCHNVVQPLDRSHMRWTLDTEEDFCFFEKVFAELGADHFYSMNEVMELLDRKPEIAGINSRVTRSARYSIVSQRTQ